MIDYGVTHCPHCEKPFAPAEAQFPNTDHARYCYGNADEYNVCSGVPSWEQDAHLIAVLQERDALRAELAQVHAGQLSLLVGVA